MKKHEAVDDLETQRKKGKQALVAAGFPKPIAERIKNLIDEATDEVSLHDALQEIFGEQLRAIVAKHLQPESSPFDQSSREWRRGRHILEVLHGEYEFSSAVSEAQRRWWYETALCFVTTHCRLYSRFFDGEFVEIA